jgi:hypothetical protein
MSAPSKAVFAATQHDARKVAAAFGFSADEWSSFGIHAALTGRRFERIVVVSPVNPTYRDMQKIAELHTLVLPEGKISVLTPTIASTVFTPQREG